MFNACSFLFLFLSPSHPPRKHAALSEYRPILSRAPAFQPRTSIADKKLILIPVIFIILRIWSTVRFILTLCNSPAVRNSVLVVLHVSIGQEMCPREALGGRQGCVAPDSTGFVGMRRVAGASRLPGGCGFSPIWWLPAPLQQRRLGQRRRGLSRRGSGCCCPRPGCGAAAPCAAAAFPEAVFLVSVEAADRQLGGAGAGLTACLLVSGGACGNRMG